jgi:hypothetical protein
MEPDDNTRGDGQSTGTTASKRGEATERHTVLVDVYA